MEDVRNILAGSVVALIPEKGLGVFVSSGATY